MDDTPRLPTDEEIELARRPGGQPRRAVLAAALSVGLLLTGGAVTGFALEHHTSKHQALSPAQVTRIANSTPPPTAGSNQQLKASDAELMGLTTLHGRRAPGFTLVDQNGRQVSLSALESRPVVLTFFDPMCTDVCPLLAQELVDAAHDLGPRSEDVSFVAVNVNPAHTSIADVARFTDEHGLKAVPHFYFLTGSPSQLGPIWKTYGVQVELNPKTGTVVHSSVMYFLYTGGAMRYQATPFANERANGTGWLPPATIAQWGNGIARYSRALLDH